MTFEFSFERVNRETFRDTFPRKIIPDWNATSNEAVLQILCSRLASLKISSPSFVAFVFVLSVEKLKTQYKKAPEKEVNLYTC